MVYGDSFPEVSTDKKIFRVSLCKKAHTRSAMSSARSRRLLFPPHGHRLPGDEPPAVPVNWVIRGAASTTYHAFGPDTGGAGGEGEILAPYSYT